MSARYRSVRELVVLDVFVAWAIPVLIADVETSLAKALSAIGNVEQAVVNATADTFDTDADCVGVDSVDHRGRVMADEVERVVPDAVFDMPDGFKAVDYTKVLACP